MKHTLVRVGVVAVALAASGCAGLQVDNKAFARPRTLALVTVMGTVSGLATTDAEEKQLLANLVTVSTTEINKSRHVKLAPESAVLSSRAYKSIKDLGPILSTDLAPGYKRFDIDEEKTNLKALARELRVDGFLIVSASYGTKSSGVGIGGILPVPIPVSAGKAYAHVTYIVSAVDVNGNTLWRDQVQLDSEEGVTTVMGVGQYKALYPTLTDLVRAASRQAVGNLNTQLAAR